MNGGMPPPLSTVPRLTRSQVERGTCARRVSQNQYSGREEHASQEEVGYLPSIHYFLWGRNFYGGLLFTNIAFL